jgi:hypothetical protein
VYHIGSQGIESSPAEGPTLSQPTSFQSSGGPPAGQTLGYHLDDLGDAEVLVVTHLVYGTDKDPAPEPGDLVDDESLEEAVLEEPIAEESESDEPMSVKPVSKLPTLYPIVE